MAMLFYIRKYLSRASARSGWIRLLLAVPIFSFAFSQFALGAQFRWLSEQDSVLELAGDIKVGDANQFLVIANSKRPKAVILSSNGGIVREALLIGDFINRSGISTVVSRDQTCASACALIWVAGKERTIQNGAKLGFHAAYDAGPEMQVSAPANALVGAYAARLGLSDMAIVLITETSPKSIHWLTPGDAKFVGLTVSWEDGGNSPTKSIASPSCESDSSCAPTPGRFGKEEIAAALLQRGMFRYMANQYPQDFQRIVRQIYEEQSSGETWTRTLFRSNGIFVLPKEIDQQVDIGLNSPRVVVRVMRSLIRFVESDRAKQKRLCKYLLENPKYLSIEFSSAVVNGPEWLRQEWLLAFDEAFQDAHDGVAKAKPATKRELAAVNRRMEKTMMTKFNQLTPSEKARARKARKLPPDLHCKLVIRVMQDVLKDRRAAEVLFGSSN